MPPQLTVATSHVTLAGADALASMRRKLCTVLVAPVLLAFTMGSTDCDSYSTVTVPAADTTPPVVLDGVYDQAAASWIVLQGGGAVYHITPGKLVTAVSSGVDSGGTRKVTMAIETGWQCCQGDICSRTSSLASPIVDSQAGAVGSSVSDGVWVGTIIGQLPVCNPGYALTSYRFAWTTTIEDFHGNKVVAPTNQAVYP